MKKIIILILCIVVFFNIRLVAQCHINDWMALKALYESTNGDSWHNNTGWQIVTGNAPTANCNLANLYGIDLNEDGRVQSCNLVANQLVGSLPSQLGSLSQLNTLNLIFNELNGSIPPELGNLNNLINLELQVNELSGNIPIALGSLSNLEGLDLANNNLTGSIPPAFGNLSNLTSLELEFNNLTGSIPPEIGNLSNLNLLALYFNQLSGGIPAALGSLNNLSDFIINNNNLSGCYPNNLQAFCTQLNPAAVNAQISQGNNFSAAWEDFCNTGTGGCGSSCIANQIIDNTTSFQHIYEAQNSIVTNGVVEISNNQQVAYYAPYISLHVGFAVQPGATFTISSVGCNKLCAMN